MSITVEGRKSQASCARLREMTHSVTAAATSSLIVFVVPRYAAASMAVFDAVGLTIGQDEVRKDEDEDGQGVEDEERRRRAIQRESERDLNDAEEGDGAAQPLMELESEVSP